MNDIANTRDIAKLQNKPGLYLVFCLISKYAQKYALKLIQTLMSEIQYYGPGTRANTCKQFFSL